MSTRRRANNVSDVAASQSSSIIGHMKMKKQDLFGMTGGPGGPPIGNPGQPRQRTVALLADRNSQAELAKYPWRQGSQVEIPDLSEQNRHNALMNQMSATLDTMLVNWREERRARRREKEKQDERKMQEKIPIALRLKDAQDAQAAKNNEGGDGEGNVPEMAKYSQDRLYKTVERLEEGLSELKIWSSVMRDISSSKEMCSSRPLAQMLDRVRQHYESYFASLDFLFVELRRRLRMDWMMENLSRKKDISDKYMKDSVKSIQEELVKEYNLSENFELSLKNLKADLEKAGKVFSGDKIAPSELWDPNVNMLYKVNDPKYIDASAEAHSKPLNSIVDDNHIFETDSKSSTHSSHSSVFEFQSDKLKKQQHQQQLQQNKASSNSISSDARSGSGSGSGIGNNNSSSNINPTDLSTRDLNQSHMFPHESDMMNEFSNLKLPAVDLNKYASDQKRVNEHILTSITMKPRLPVTPIRSGQKLNNIVTLSSIYYRFTIGPDDSGIFLRLSQNPAGDKHNYLEITLNFGVPPTAADYSHVISTRDKADVVLDVHNHSMRPGDWFMRVGGRGSRQKMFTFEFRVYTVLVNFSTPIAEVLDDMATQVHWQENVAEKMAIVDDVCRDVMMAEGKNMIEMKHIGIQGNNPPILNTGDNGEDESGLQIGERGFLGAMTVLFSCPPPPKESLRHLSKKALMRTLVQIYMDKMAADVQCDKDNLPRTTLSVYLYDFFKQRYGQVNLSEMFLHELIDTMREKYSKVLRVQTFCR
jgi:hypothetical protein